jgi:tocopherol cyclase
MNSLQNILHPDNYHGHGKKPPFFEGWYFKIVSKDEKQRYAIIPGTILGEKGHAFVQVLNGSTGESAYHTFPLEDFWASDETFEIRIGSNQFSRERVYLQIDDELGKIGGELHFKGICPWPISLLSPGIMGWYAWVPFMECYHGVVSLDHTIDGILQINETEVDFDGGTGYIEKDWGQSFPEAYIWFQSNHFDQPGVCITGSVAIIPWLGSAFRGFIVGLWHANRLFRFATYTGARLEKLELDDKCVEWVIRDRSHRLEISATRAGGGLLFGPTRLEMGKRVNETMSSRVDVRLSTISGEQVLSGTGRNAGLEAHGDIDKLLGFH